MNDFKNMSDRYRQQMLDLYKRYPKEVIPTKSNAIDTQPMPKIEDTQPIPPKQEDLSTTIDETPKPQEAQTTTDDDSIPIEEKYPEPIIPPFIYQSNHPNDTTIVPNKPIESNHTPKNGYLKVVTTSAEGTIPLENVSVIVSKAVDDHQEILFTLLTNASGETTIIELPAPSEELSEKPSNSNVKPYAEYNVSAYLNGYFQVINTQVPIFAGITSIQNVNMIPLPSHTDERKVLTITIPENEPNL